MQVDRFILEEKIQNCWNVTNDIDLLFRNVCDKEITPDQIANCLLGMKELYNMRFDELFTTFEKLVSERKVV